MGQSYKIVTTNLGRTAVRFALAQGTSVKLTHMAVGDGGGQDVEPMSSGPRARNVPCPNQRDHL